MSSRYSFRERTKAVRAEVESKEEAAKQRKRKNRPAHAQKVAKAVKIKRASITVVTQTVLKEQEKCAATCVKIPGLTLLEGETGTIDLPNLSIPDCPCPSTDLGEKADTPVQAFDAAIRTYLASVDACHQCVPESKPRTRELRGTVEKEQQIQEAFERALAFQASATESLASATDSLALGRYFLKVYADSGVPLGQPLKFGLRNWLPGWRGEAASPIDDFSWIKLDWFEGLDKIPWQPYRNLKEFKFKRLEDLEGRSRQVDWAGKDTPHEFSPILSPQSTPHTVSIHLLPDDPSSLEPIQIYSRTFEHRISTCPHPSLCPLCKYRGSEAPVQIAMSQSVETPRIIVSRPELTSEIEAKTDISSDRKESLASLENNRSRSLQTPPPNDPYMSNATPPTPSPGTKGTRAVEVSVFYKDAVLTGGPRRVETSACESFDDFKKQVGIRFEDLFAKSRIPFERVVYDKLVLFNEGESVLDTESGTSSRVVWDEFISLLEARKGSTDEAKGVVGSVEIFMD